MDCTISNETLLSRSTEALIGFRDQSRLVVASWASFGLPNAWQVQSPFRVPGMTEQVDVSVRGRPVARRTLHYGFENWDGNACEAQMFDTRNPFGKICIENTTAPFYAAFGAERGDTCSLSNEDYNVTNCSSDRYFTIGIR